MTDWAQALATQIGKTVQQYRRYRGVSAQQLADRTKELGHPVHRSVIANLESGRRPVVTIHEVLVFAAVLQVPPMLLVFPGRSSKPLEVLPGQEMDSWAALRWLVGDGPGPGDGADWAVEAESLTELRRHDELVTRWEQAQQRLAEFRQFAVRIEVDPAGAPSPHQQAALLQMLAALDETAHQVVEELTAYRAELRGRGVSLPGLPDNLAQTAGVG